MPLTEAEAKERWCPHARAVEGCNRPVVDLGLMSAATRCIASGCMAWRFVATGSYDSEGRFVPDGGHSERGYCGLAGEPR